MNILAIDPGNANSAYVFMSEGQVLEMDKLPNDDLLHMIDLIPWHLDAFVIEMIASYGMPVGREVFETCVWIGRFIQRRNDTHHLAYRKDIKLHLCGTTRAKDANIRQALLDRFPATGGGKIPQVGTKAMPGPLYGIHSDIWAALAVAVYYSDTHKEL